MVYFVSGTDTDVGKSVATGFLAKRFAQSGAKVITQKLAQTGCQGISIDIITHRKIMGIDLLPEDRTGVTCADVFDFPASPHLAAKMQNASIDIPAIARRTEVLAQHYDVVLMEGVGGLMVPLKDDFLVVDYISKYSLGTFLVVSSKLGSLNHALLCIEACLRRNISIAGIVYNTFAKAPKEIEESTAEYIKGYLSRYSPHTQFITMGRVEF